MVVVTGAVCGSSRAGVGWSRQVSSTSSSTTPWTCSRPAPRQKPANKLSPLQEAGSSPRQVWAQLWDFVWTWRSWTRSLSLTDNKSVDWSGRSLLKGGARWTPESGMYCFTFWTKLRGLLLVRCFDGPRTRVDGSSPTEASRSCDVTFLSAGCLTMTVS